MRRGSGTSPVSPVPVHPQVDRGVEGGHAVVRVDVVRGDPLQEVPVEVVAVRHLATQEDVVPHRPLTPLVPHLTHVSVPLHLSTQVPIGVHDDTVETRSVTGVTGVA